MADRVLRTELIVDAKKGIETLKTVEKIGNQTVKTISRNGEQISKTITTVSGQSANSAKLSFIAAAQGASLLLQTIGPTVKALGEMRQAAIDDEESITRRNAALQRFTDISPQFVQSLDDQVSSYQKLYGISDTVTREIQTQITAFGDNKDQVGILTDATIRLATITGEDYLSAAVKVRKFMDGELGNSIRGTTISVDKNADAHDRLNALLEGTQSGLTILTDKMGEGKVASDKWKEATDELKEAIGAAFNTEYAVGQIEKLTAALFGLADFIGKYGAQFDAFGRGLTRFMVSAGTGGISELGNKYNEARNFINRNKYGVTGGIPGPAVQVKSGGGQEFPGYTIGGGGGSSYSINRLYRNENLAAMAGSVIGGGGIGGLLGTVGGMFGPVGGILGGLAGRLFGGGGKHQDRGMTPATPIYVEDVKLADMLSQQANVSRVGMLGGGAGFVDRQLQGLRLQGMRVNR